MKTYPAYISRHNLNHENQIIPLMIPKRKAWHYLAVKKLPAGLRGIFLKHDGSFYCLSCLHSFRTKNKLKSHKKVHENKGFCGFVMPSEDTKILEFNQYQNSDKVLSIIHANLESLIKT